MSVGSPVEVGVETAITGVAGKVARVYVAKKFAAAELTAGPVPPMHSASVSLPISIDHLSAKKIPQMPQSILIARSLQPRGFSYGDVQAKYNSIFRNQR